MACTYKANPYLLKYPFRDILGNLPDKEFRIMIVKLIQNLEITYFTCIEYLLLIGTNLVLGMQWKQNKLDPLSL